MSTTALLAPKANSLIYGRHGTNYTSDAFGLINVNAADVLDMLAAGCVYTQNGGTFVLNGASAVTVANAAVQITDTIAISLNTVGGTVGVQPHITTITAGTGFTVIGTASDTSTYNYMRFPSAA